MFKGEYDSAKKKLVPVYVPAIITGFGFGFNGIRGTKGVNKFFDGEYHELTQRIRVDYILVRVRPNGKEYKVPAKYCHINDRRRK